MLKKILILFLCVVLATETFAVVVSDNDGSAFITKAEFDSLRNDFQTQVNSYNNFIDSKIDNAIASYLAGVKMTKERRIDMRNSARKIYCMKVKSDTEAKDLAYAWTKPKMTGSGVTGVYQKNIANAHGCYMHQWTLSPLTTISATGKRNLIKNHYKVSDTLGYAEWVGHVDNVYDDFEFLVNEVNFDNWDQHFNETSPYAMIRSANSYIYNKTPNEASWVLFKLCARHTAHGWDRDFRLADAVVSGYNLNTDSASYRAENLVIWQDETYYAFTEQDRNAYLLFDANNISGWTTSKTTAPVLYSNINKSALYTNTNVYYLSEYFNTVKAVVAFRQHNMNDTSGNALVDPATRTFVKTSYGNYLNTTSQTGVYSDYLSQNGRLLWPAIGFPYKTITNWNRLYKSENDWAVNLTNTPSSSSIFRFNNRNHLSLKGGWPVVEMQKDKVYEFEIKFDETTNDHLLFGKLYPFDSNIPQNENCILWDKNDDSRFNKKALIVKAGETAKLSIKAAEDSVLYLKWCDRPDEAITSPVLKGGGTIVLPDYVMQKSEN